LSSDHASEIAETTPSKQCLRLWLRMLRATRSIEGDIRELLRREFDTTLPRFDVMAALYRKPEGMMLSELSRELMVSNGNVTGIVDRLEDDGYIFRGTRNGDRRTSHISLTGNGSETFEMWAKAHEVWITRRLRDLDEAQTADAIEIMKHIGQSAEGVKR